MDIFDTCRDINSLLENNFEDIARDELIKLLDYHKKNDIEYSKLVNHLIRETGLYPYMDKSSASWQDKFVYEAFKVDVGQEEEMTLHREQSKLLKRLLEGDNIAISAPTSFGKSFIIDAFISIKKPENVVIIVPTIALTDETRRRLYSKFSDEYKIITTSEAKLSKKNIFVFPQERATSYINKLDKIDILIIDEFYKASPEFDEERSPTLLKTILELGKKAKQKYFLAPNISDLNDNFFTEDLDFVELKFNTVFLEKNYHHDEINGDEELKSKKLLEILDTEKKSLIYAGTYTNIDKVSNLIFEHHEQKENELLNNFSNWLKKNYSPTWILTNLIRRGAGIHNGRLHRSLSQLQVRLFEEPNGLKNLISTSSIIEGVNTSAENVIIWRNKNGNYNLDDFTYKNIIGRGGRMFKHFVGNIYVLEDPPTDDQTQLNLSLPNELLGDIDESEYQDKLTEDQISQIANYKQKMYDLIGKENYEELKSENAFQLNDSQLHLEIAEDMYQNSYQWRGLSYLNSNNVNQWDNSLYKILRLKPGSWETSYSKFVAFVKILSQNWGKSIPSQLKELETHDIDVKSFFQLERVVSYRLASLLNDVNIFYRHLINEEFDLSAFVSSLSHVFLPSVVYQLEEYGLPRMISKKIHINEIINFEDKELDIHSTLNLFNEIGKSELKRKTHSYLDDFDRYIIDFFYEGITLKR